MEHIGNYLGIIALIIIGFLAIKKITSCLFKAVVGVIKFLRTECGSVRPKLHQVNGRRKLSTC